MGRNNHTKPINQGILPNPIDAVQLYQQQGGYLRDPYQAGTDPLDGDAYRLGVRHEAFVEKYPSFQDIFSRLVNNDSTVFQKALKFYIDITFRIASSH